MRRPARRSIRVHRFLTSTVRRREADEAGGPYRRTMDQARVAVAVRDQKARPRPVQTASVSSVPSSRGWAARSSPVASIASVEPTVRRMDQRAAHFDPGAREVRSQQRPPPTRSRSSTGHVRRRAQAATATGTRPSIRPQPELITATDTGAGGRWVRPHDQVAHEQEKRLSILLPRRRPRRRAAP